MLNLPVELVNDFGWRVLRRSDALPGARGRQICRSTALAYLEQRRYRGSEFWPSLGQLRGTHGKHVHLCPADDDPEILEEPADLILNIPLDLGEQSSADKNSFDRVTVEIPDADLLVPSTLYNGAMPTASLRSLIVDLHLQSRLGRLGIDEYDGQPHLIQLSP